MSKSRAIGLTLAVFAAFWMPMSVFADCPEPPGTPWSPTNLPHVEILECCCAENIITADEIGTLSSTNLCCNVSTLNCNTYLGDWYFSAETTYVEGDKNETDLFGRLIMTRFPKHMGGHYCKCNGSPDIFACSDFGMVGDPDDPNNYVYQLYCEDCEPDPGG